MGKYSIEISVRARKELQVHYKSGIDILHHLKEMDSIGFYEATGSTSLRVPAGSCCRPLMRFA